MSEELVSRKADRGLEHRIDRCLDAGDFPEREKIRASAEGGVVRLQGRLKSPRSKAILLDCCRHVPGVVRVVDELAVDPRHSFPAKPSARQLVMR